MSSDIVKRLRGEYRIPITDGHGPAGGDEPDNPKEFVRHFETPPIQKEAAAYIEALEGEYAAYRETAHEALRAANARAERLRVALELIASDPTNSAQAMVARKALEDDKPIRAAGDGR